MQSIKNDTYCSYTSQSKTECRMQRCNKHHNKTQLCGSTRGRIAHYAHPVHKVCTGPYPSSMVVPSTNNVEPCYASI